LIHQGLGHCKGGHRVLGFAWYLTLECCVPLVLKMAEITMPKVF
jgi:hypothetical protein